MMNLFEKNSPFGTENDESQNQKLSPKNKDPDHPRTRMKKLGKQSLSTAETLSLIIGSGNEQSVTIAKRILKAAEYNLHNLSRMSLQELGKIEGVGAIKASKIIACLEIGNRRSLEKAQERFQASSSESAFRFFHPILAHLKHEEFWVAYLNTHNKIIGKTQLSKGSINATITDIRLIFKKALELGAVQIICAHNHPSRAPRSVFV